MNENDKSIFSNIGGDVAAGLVVFFVAVPLCLGIALASGAPLFSGIVAGIIGGLVVGFASKSALSVSGPAAGLAAIVLVAITELGAFNIFLCAVIIAGIIQIILGFLKAGTIANYFPSNVIEGMLAGIGVLIILKQIPHAVGFDKDFEGNESFHTLTYGNTFSVLASTLEAITLGALIVSVVAIILMRVWESVPALKKLKVLPGPLVAVIVGVILNEIFKVAAPQIAIQQEHLVNLPVTDSFQGFIGQFTQPDFSGFFNSQVWFIGITLAIVASIETLLSLEAVDRIDPLKRYTPTNRELKAQGIGNIISGLLGGLPMTSVIVRSSANVNAGAKTKLSTITHGAMILVCVALIPVLLNKIPLAALAAILLMTGYKLAKPALFSKWWSHGLYQFIPFVVTIVAIVFTDLLKGVALGMVVSIFFILRENLKSVYFFERKKHEEGDIIHINLAQEVTFLNKAAIKMTLEHLPEDSYVIIDATQTNYIDHDVLELIREFQAEKVKERGIRLEIVGFKSEYKIENTLSSHVYSEHSQEEVESREAKGEHSKLIEQLTSERFMLMNKEVKV
ncbi:MAG TPA: solute carrier family 23 protein [Pyrinomonadaceae bacterium]|nr:solute carrier family 23 protein [Pyrinomonadaceae bacterium]